MNRILTRTCSTEQTLVMSASSHPGAAVDAGLVARASALRPLLAQHADRTEAERQVVPEVMPAMEDAGLFEVIVPERLGGLGGSMATQLCVAAELGKACA